ncbi:MAG: hypothetical protein IJI45_17525 [Anaerolineaceae bacterium]|nr:hypothetical protein [Anaerolineaceae bacterium]
MNLIDASKPETFPEELEDIVIMCLSRISEKEKQKLRNNPIINENDVQCAIESYFSPKCSAYYHDIYSNELIPAFNNYGLLCFHATRIGCIEDITRNGLFLRQEKYAQYLSEFLRSKGVAEKRIQGALEAISKEYDKKRRELPRDICFFVNYGKLHGCVEEWSYDVYCENVGGELAKGALTGEMQDILSILQTNGIPVIVKFKIPFQQVTDIQKDTLIYQFVACVVAKQLWNFNYVIDADAATTEEIPPGNIIKVMTV